MIKIKSCILFNPNRKNSNFLIDDQKVKQPLACRGQMPLCVLFSEVGVIYFHQGLFQWFDLKKK